VHYYFKLNLYYNLSILVT